MEHIDVTAVRSTRVSSLLQQILNHVVVPEEAREMQRSEGILALRLRVNPEFQHTLLVLLCLFYSSVTDF